MKCYRAMTGNEGSEYFVKGEDVSKKVFMDDYKKSQVTSSFLDIPEIYEI